MTIFSSPRGYDADAPTLPMALRRGLARGEMLPCFELASTAGRVRQTDWLGAKPLVFAFGDAGTARIRAAGAVLSRLFRTFGSRVGLLLITRANRRAPLDVRIREAHDVLVRAAVPFPVAVDDPHAPLAEILDATPGAVFAMDTDGRLALDAPWTIDEARLRRAIAELVEPPTRDASGTFPVLDVALAKAG